MNAPTSLVSLHLAGEAEKDLPDALTLDTLPGQFTLTRTPGSTS